MCASDARNHPKYAQNIMKLPQKVTNKILVS